MSLKKPTVIVNGKPQTNSGNAAPVRRTNFDANSLEGEAHARSLNDMQATLQDLHDAHAANTLNTHIIFTSQVFNAGVQVDLPHGLGKPYTGFKIIKCDATIEFTNGVLPSGKSAMTHIPIVSSNTCTADVMVF